MGAHVVSSMPGAVVSSLVFSGRVALQAFACGAFLFVGQVRKGLLCLAGDVADLLCGLAAQSGLVGSAGREVGKGGACQLGCFGGRGVPADVGAQKGACVLRGGVVPGGLQGNEVCELPGGGDDDAHCVDVGGSGVCVHGWAPSRLLVPILGNRE